VVSAIETEYEIVLSRISFTQGPTLSQ